ncbi:hypothetical protein CYMTET_50269 [Cymbomonas tetramitiformis]|uniref:Uncharacterized protein n=1 Tax=Cymbomonas tetramitiformis TaxID=36881 RepID=A0AAE0BPM4_9CHLO|nr:hypothetical protein CYMTET_50269 [Cymbomonas tetramitiformis]
MPSLTGSEVNAPTPAPSGVGCASSEMWDESRDGQSEQLDAESWPAGLQEASSGKLVGLQEASSGKPVGLQEASSGKPVGLQEASSGKPVGLQEASSGKPVGLQEASSGKPVPPNVQHFPEDVQQVPQQNARAAAQTITRGVLQPRSQPRLIGGHRVLSHTVRSLPRFFPIVAPGDPSSLPVEAQVASYAPEQSLQAYGHMVSSKGSPTPRYRQDRGQQIVRAAAPQAEPEDDTSEKSHMADLNPAEPLLTDREYWYNYSLVLVRSFTTCAQFFTADCAFVILS